MDWEGRGNSDFQSNSLSYGMDGLGIVRAPAKLSKEVAPAICWLPAKTTYFVAITLNFHLILTRPLPPIAQPLLFFRLCPLRLGDKYPFSL